MLFCYNELGGTIIDSFLDGGAQNGFEGYKSE
jgi:hypothetical protein